MPIRLTEERNCWLHGPSIHVNMKCLECEVEDYYPEYDATDDIDRYVEEQNDIRASRFQEFEA